MYCTRCVEEVAPENAVRVENVDRPSEESFTLCRRCSLVILTEMIDTRLAVVSNLIELAECVHPNRGERAINAAGRAV